MKKLFYAAVAVLLSAAFLLGCSNQPGKESDTFASTYYLAEDGRSLSISGPSYGTPGRQSGYTLKIENGVQTWQDECWVLLVDSDSVVQEVAHERFELAGSGELQKTVTVQFPKDFTGALGLCVIIPERATMISTLSVGTENAVTTGWPDADTLRSYLQGEGS